MIRLVVGLFLIVVPVLELAVLIKIGQWIGVGMTVALVITTAFTGILIISQQSFTVLRRTLEAVSEGRPPVAQVLDGLFLMAAGALLLTPGLMTDVLALLLLVPPIRRAVARWSMGQVLQHAPVDADADDQPRHRKSAAQKPPGRAWLSRANSSASAKHRRVPVAATEQAFPRARSFLMEARMRFHHRT